MRSSLLAWERAALADQVHEQLAVVDHLVVPPSCGYSLAIVLKQCGHWVMTFFTPRSSRVSMFCRASCWKTYSLPVRRAGSPVHISSGPRMAKSTPASCRSLAIATVTFLVPVVERAGAADPVQVLGGDALVDRGA
jgi:hypothetical protein